MGAAFAQIGLNVIAGEKQHGAMSGIPGAPDLSGNVKQANAISDTATDQAGQVYNTAQAYNKNAQDSLSAITGTQLPVVNRLADTTNQNLSTYGSTFTPLQQKQAQDALDYGSDANIQRRQGMAVADQASAAEAARKRSADALAAEGVDPASIQGGALDRQAALDTAKNEAGASTQSALQTEDTARGLVQSANTLGLQVGQLGNAGAQTGAQVGSSLLSGTNQTNQIGVSNLTADNGLLETGASANKSGSDIASDAFTNEMEAYKAKVARAAVDAENTKGIMSMAGGGVVPGGTAGIMEASNYAGGGRVSGKGALPVGPNPAKPTDTKPALLTPDEYVIPKDVATHKGHEFFHKLIDKTRIDMRNRSMIPNGPAVGA